MTTDFIYKTVLDTVEEMGYDRSSISDSTNFITDLNMDSLTLFEMQYMIESKLGFKLDSGEQQSLLTVNELVNCIIDKLNLARQERS